MAKTGDRDDPILSFRFEITLNNLEAGGFSECSGLQLETEFQDYAEGGQNQFLLKFPTRTKQTNLVLKRGIVNTAMWQWYFELTQGQVRYRDGSILVRDPAGDEVVMEWQFFRALPAKWQGPELNAAQSTIAVETLELVHQGLLRRK